VSLEQAFGGRRNTEGKSANELWAEERTRLLALPAVPFAVSRMVSVEVSSQALVKVEGATYSVPSRWARLTADAYVGVDQIRIVCLGASVTHPRARAGSRTVRYRYYLTELPRKPKAVRQVAPELIAELGEPWHSLAAARRGLWRAGSGTGVGASIGRGMCSRRGAGEPALAAAVNERRVTCLIWRHPTRPHRNRSASRRRWHHI